MVDLKKQIIDYVRKKGPSTPIDVAVGTGLNSIVVSAIISDTLPKKQLLRNCKRIGSSYIYYLPEQRDRMRSKTLEFLDENEKKFLKQLERKKVFLSGDMPEEVVSEYGDFLTEFTFGGKKAWHWFGISSNEALKILESRAKEKKPIVPEVKKPKKPKKKEEKVPVIKVEKESEDKNYASLVRGWLTELGAEMRDFRELSKGTEYEMDVMMPTPLGTQRYLLVVLNYSKRKVNVGDVSKAFTKVMQQKIPVILVSATGFAKNAEKFWKREYKGLVTLVDGRELT